MQIDNRVLFRMATVLGLVCAVVAIYLLATTDSRARNNLKKQCGAGMDCACFSNIVDNRLSRPQVRAFIKFLDSIKTRPTTNIMEFVDEASAQTISSAISLCRVQTAPAQPTNNKK